MKTGIFLLLAIVSSLFAQENLIDNYRMQIDSYQGVTAQLPSIENDPGAVVGNCLNVITGKYFEYSVDAVTRGPESLPIYRNYFSEALPVFHEQNNHMGERRDKIDPEDAMPTIDEEELPNLYGWHLNQNYSLFTDETSAHLADRHGSNFQYSILNRGVFKVYKFDPAALRGVTNFSAGIISAQTNCKNALLHYNPGNNHYEAHDPDGTIRYYGKPRRNSSFWSFWDSEIRSLEKEYRPSGQWIVHQNQSRSGYRSTTTVDSTNTKAYSWIKYQQVATNYPEHYTLVSNSDGKTFRYDCYRGDGYKPDFLRQVTRPDGTKIIIEMTQDYKFWGKILPEGRRLHLEFDDQGRVKQIQQPIGIDQKLINAYTMEYHPKFSDVFDAHGHGTRYHFDSEWRLFAKEFFFNNRQYCVEANFYGDNKGPDAGNIICKSLRDGSGNNYFCRSFTYDIKGNVLCEKLHGNLSGHCTAPLNISVDGKLIEGGECYTRNYTYLGGVDERFNNILIEGDQKSSIHYRYLPGTALLTAKYIVDNAANIIHQREFREYDKDRLLIKIILDDGSALDPYDLSGCSERKITKIAPRQSSPGIGQPELIEECYYDFDTKKEQLLKKTHNHYSPQNLIIKQDIYNADSQYAYSLHKEYDIMDRLTSETDAMGNRFSMTYDANGNLIKKSGMGLESILTYDYSNRLIKKLETDISTKQQHVEHLRYDLLGNCVAKIDHFGNETQYLYDCFSRQIQILHPPCKTESGSSHSSIKKDYDILGNVTQLIDECGHATRMHYSSNKKLTRLSDGESEETMEYDVYGNLVKKIAKNGSTTVYQYDFLNRLISNAIHGVAGELLSEESHAYKGFQRTQSIDAQGCVILYTYDGAGRPKTVEKLLEDGTHTKTIKEYDALGNVGSIKEWHGTGAEDYTAKLYRYDVAGHVLQETIEDSQGTIFHKISYAYDQRGNRTQITTYPEGSSGSTTITYYDAFNRPYEITDPFGNRKRYEYKENYTNELGQKVLQLKVTDELGITTSTTYDARGRVALLEKTDSFGKPIQSKTFTYDGIGNKTSEKEQIFNPDDTVRNLTHRFRYDSKNRLESQIEEDGEPHARTTRFFYNPADELICKQTYESEIEYAYDALGRLICEKAQSLKGSYEPYHITFTYNAHGQPTEIRNQIQGTATRRKYDIIGRITEETQESGLTLRYRYDLSGRKTALILPDRTEISYTYQGPYLFSIRYQGLEHRYEKRDLTGRIEKSLLMGQAGAVHYGSDLMGRANKIDSPHWSEHIPHNGYGPSGNLKNLKAKDCHGEYQASYSYDSNDQLTQENGHFAQQFSYDSAYNRLNKNGKPHQIGKFHQLLHDGQRSYQWDSLGNLSQCEDAHYRYDAICRLVHFSTKGTDAAYSYDGLHRRISRRINKGTLSYFLYDDLNEIGTVDSQGNLLELRILGEGLGAEIGATVAIKLKKQLYAAINDHRGNISCLIDIQTGAPKECYRYSAYGEEETFNGKGQASTSQNPWRFSSKRYDSESHLIYFGRRYYNPEIGRFITQDPIGYKDGPNLYAYTRNNPLTHYDLYGLKRDGNESIINKDSSFLGSCLDLISRGVHLLGMAIEWIGKNLIPLPGARDLIEAAGRFAAGGNFLAAAEYHKSRTLVGYVGGENFEGKRYVYINGVFTTLEECQEQARYLSEKLGGVRVYYIYNSTKGLVSDLLECFLGKIGVMGSPDKLGASLLRQLTNEVKAESANGMVAVFAHSQGCLHMNNMAHGLSGEESKTISLYAYGPAAIINPSKYFKVENYISMLDFVPLFNILQYTQAVMDNLFNRQSNVQFLKPTSWNPLREHFLMDSKKPTTYQQSLGEVTSQYRKEMGL